MKRVRKKEKRTFGFGQEGRGKEGRKSLGSSPAVLQSRRRRNEGRIQGKFFVGMLCKTLYIKLI